MTATGPGLRARLEALARDYPPQLVEHELADVPRISDHVALVARRHGLRARVCDVGGGVGLFSLGCAAVGMSVTLIDDFRDPVNAEVGERLPALHAEHGVEVIERDVIAHGVELEARSFDAVTTFDSLEHWHHSPKRLLHQLVEALKPRGSLLIGVPNRVNARKRLTMLAGRNQWSPMDEWYEAQTFRGHVREPDIRDLGHIARDLDLTEVEVWGRNWLGLTHGNPVTRAAARIADRPLRLRPGLCSDIYMAGRRPSIASTSSRPRAS